MPDLAGLAGLAGITARLGNVLSRVAAAAGRSGRASSSVRLVAISKTFPSECVRAAHTVGQLEFGENKVQEGEAKIAALRDLPLRWHLVGHLQSNKAARAAELFDVIHSIDSPALVTRLDRAAAAAGRSVDGLIQVDLADEATKHGAKPGELESILDAGRGCGALKLVGLMLLPPAVDEPEEARSYFASLRRLRDALLERGFPSNMLAELSMGMSHDFEVAIEEGATMVRVGSSIFGARSISG